MARAAALIIADNHIALIERRNTSSPLPYYLFPGGRVEDGETATEAVIREVWEELGLCIVVQHRVAAVRYHGDSQYYFTATVTGGTFGAGTGTEMTGTNTLETGSYRPIWMLIDRILTEPVYPRGVAALVVEAAQSGWLVECVEFEDEGRDRHKGAEAT